MDGGETLKPGDVLEHRSYGGSLLVLCLGEGEDGASFDGVCLTDDRAPSRKIRNYRGGERRADWFREAFERVLP